MYYIYEIASERKVGVTDNVERRLNQHIANYGVSPREFSILEYHTDIYKVSERELEIQAEKGYPVDTHPYWYVRQVQHKKATTKESRKKAIANTDWKAARKKAVASTDYKAIAAKKDHKAAQSHRQRAIISISPDGIRTCHSGIAQAGRELNIHGNGVQSCLGGRQNTYKGYKFEYADSK